MGKWMGVFELVLLLNIEIFIESHPIILIDQILNLDKKKN